MPEVLPAGEERPFDDQTRIGGAPRPRWYPVVDYGRCALCLECMNFCLFGVFGLDASEELIVESPDACRDGCPACARVCPTQAIMFPTHNNPAIAGDPAAKPGSVDIQLVQLLGPGPKAIAAAERAKAVEQQSRQRPTVAPRKDDLDAMVDELDRADL